MADEIKVEVIGAQEVMEALAELPEDVQREVLEEVLEGSALVIEQEAKRLAPKRTGALADSIEAREVRPRRGAFKTWAVGPKIRYAAFVEFGTAHNPAKPYMRPTKDNKRDEVLRDAREDIIAGVERLAEGKAR